MKKLINVLSLIGIISIIGYSQSQGNILGERKQTRPMEASVKNYHGRPTIFIDDQPFSPMIYALTDAPGGRWSNDDVPQLNIKLFAELGIKLFQVDLTFEYMWLQDGTLDLTRAKKQIQGVLEVCPDAGIIFRLHVNAPKWWTRLHPEEKVKYDGVAAKPDPEFSKRQPIAHDAGLADRFSLASEKWLDSSTEMVKRFCREFAATPEGQHLVGIQVACGIYGEWHYWGFLHWEPDFGMPMQQHFREWVIAKYRTVDKLRRVWNDPAIEFADVSVPITAERAATSAGVFRDPQKDQKVIDYYTCQHELVRDDVLHFCRVVKENWPRPIITGAFYGYFFSVFNRLAAGSQLDLEPVLKSPYIDYLCGPQAYGPEAFRAGEPYRSRSLITSMRLNGKLWLDEMDQEPRRILPYGSHDVDNKSYEKSLSENIALITRNTMYSHSKGMGLWYYDFGPAGFHTHPDWRKFPLSCLTGYWDHPRYLDCIRQLKGIFDEKLYQDYTSEADVLLVYDTKSQYHVQSVGDGDPVSAQLIDQMSLASFYAGVIFDPVHICDLDKIDFSQYKMVVFGNAFVIDGKTRAIIREKLARENRHLLWCYAPGFSDGQRLSADFVQDITGFSLKKNACVDTPSVAIASEIGSIPDQMPKGVCDPLFSIDDPQAEIFGHYRHDQSPAMGRKEFGTHTSWFIGVPPTDADLLRFIYQSAGVHIYNSDRDVFYGGSGILTMHTRTGGHKTITLKNGKTVTLDLPATPSTILMDCETGDVLYKGL